jgi:hypothetical protein
MGYRVASAARRERWVNLAICSWVMGMGLNLPVERF